MNMDPEVASAARFILTAVGGAKPYYWSVPESFHVPAVFIPVPKVESHGDTTGTYRLSFTLFVKLFAATTEEAHEMAFRALNAIRRMRNAIPLVEPEGDPVYKRDTAALSEAEGRALLDEIGETMNETNGAPGITKFRVQDPEIQSVDDGVWQLTLRWNSAREYAKADATRSARAHVLDESGRRLAMIPAGSEEENP